MTIKEMVMIRDALCEKSVCGRCLLDGCEDCLNIHNLNEYLTHEKETELKNWYHENVNTYINDFCKKFPHADREYVVNNICCDMIYKGCECND